MKSVYVLISITTLILFSSCGDIAVTGQDETKSSTPSFTFEKAKLSEMGITSVPVTENWFYQAYWATGKIGVPPEDQTLILSPFEGRLSNFKWMPGQTIKKGEVLGTIASVELLKIQSDFQSADANYVRLRDQYERDQILFEEQIIPLKALQSSKSELERAEAIRNGLLAMASLLSVGESELSADHPLVEVAIKAPFTGELSEVVAQNGALVTSNAPLAKITAVGHKHIEFEVFESVVSELKEGDEVEVYAIDDSTDIAGRLANIHLIGSAVESESSAVPFHADFNDESEHNHWILGQFARIKLKVTPERAAALPESALFQIENGYYGLKIVSQTESTISVERVKLDVQDRQNQTLRALKQDSKFAVNTQFLSGNIADLLW